MRVLWALADAAWFLPRIAWVVVNAFFTEPLPFRFRRVRKIPRASWLTRGGATDSVAADLTKLGFVEIGAVASWVGLSRETDRVFWNDAVRCYAFLGRNAFEPRLLLATRVTVDPENPRDDRYSGILVTQELYGPKADVRIQVNRQGGAPAAKLASHQAALQAYEIPPSQGTLEEAVPLKAELEDAYMGWAPPGDEGLTLERVPHDLEVAHDHHGLVITAPRPRDRPWWLSDGLLFVAFFAAGGATNLSWGLSAAGALMFLFMFIQPWAWSDVELRLSASGLVIQSKLGTQRIRASEQLTVNVRGSRLVLDDGKRRYRVRVGRTHEQRHWLARVIRTTLVREPPDHDEEGEQEVASETLRALAMRARAAQRARHGEGRAR